MKGFTKDSKFHPISPSKGVSRKKRIHSTEMMDAKGGVKVHIKQFNEGIRLKRTRLKNKPENFLEWGFDLTDFEPDTFPKMLNQLGMPLDPRRSFHEDGQGRGFVWETEGLLIETKNNPITGQYGQPQLREPEKNYAGYIGIEGTPEQVKETVKLIKKYSDSEDESPNVRNFI